MNGYDTALRLYTMAKDGEDGTFAPLGEPLPEMGYYVGGKFPSLVFKNADELDRGEIAWWVGRNPARFYGVWVDQETGKIYFDGVTHMNLRGTALDLAKVRKELAIWDIAQGEEIRVDPVQ